MKVETKVTYTAEEKEVMKKMLGIAEDTLTEVNSKYVSQVFIGCVNALFDNLIAVMGYDEELSVFLREKGFV